jgi:tetratricopeptide (TPR) repeat protein
MADQTDKNDKATHAIPESLIERIRAGRAALVLGSSIGALAGMPSWKKLLDKLREAVEQRGKEGDAKAAEDVAGLLKKGRLTTACGFLARDLGGEACDTIIAEAWKSPDILPESAKVLGRVPIKAIWTTFPGDFVERAVQSGSPDLWPAARVGTYQNAGELEPRRRHILKLLGDLANGSYVVIPTSVRRALANAQAFRDRLQDLYNDGALIFVGFRVGDPDLQALFDKVFGSFEVPAVEHYFVAAGLGPVDTEELEAEHHMKVIPLEGQGGDEKSTESLVEFLGALATECEKAGISLAVTRPPDDDLEGWMERYHADPKDQEAIDALAAIEKQAREVGVSDRLVEVLMGRAEVEADSPTRAKLLREVARIFEEQIGDLPRAFTALTAALRENPADEEVINAAARLAQETDGYGELVADLSELVPQIQDKKVAAGHLVRLGKWYAEKLHHDDYAIASWREALKRDGALREAREGLEEMYRKQQKWGDLAAELVQHAEVESDNGRRVDIFLALADLYETQLASTAKAMEAYEKVADIDHDNEESLAALERLYRRGERWGKLATVLERRAEKIATHDPGRAAAMRKELAGLRSEKLGDVEGAIARYEAAVQSNDRDLDALKALEKLYEKVGRTDDYTRTLERLAEVGPEGERAAMWRSYSLATSSQASSAR